MKLSYGGEFASCLPTVTYYISNKAANLFHHSITRLMGESFKLHSQALVGYVDDLEASSNVSTPSMISQGADEDSVY